MKAADGPAPAPAPAPAPTLSIVVPCFNEQAALPATHARLSAQLRALIDQGKACARSELIYVDDGSRDATWTLISGWSRSGAPVVGVKLSRNCGHQNALLAGMACARGDAVVTIDADLQDDASAIEAMLDAFAQGCEVVYGVRRRRDCDTWFKRGSARLFYRLMNALGVRTLHDHADYRLLSRRAVRLLQRFGEANLFLRGVVPLLGLRSAVVPYDRQARVAGESKYPLRKMLEFAVDGITSFSTAPLRGITWLGLGVSLACVAATAWAAVAALVTHKVLPGWASTALPIFFLGGVQLFCIGVLGEYVGKIYQETKRRPRYLIESVAGGTPLCPGATLAAEPGVRGSRPRLQRQLRPVMQAQPRMQRPPDRQQPNQPQPQPQQPSLQSLQSLQSPRQVQAPPLLAQNGQVPSH